MILIERMFANRARKAMSDAGRTLGAARQVNKNKRNETTQRLRNCVQTGRIAHLGWPR